MSEDDFMAYGPFARYEEPRPQHRHYTIRVTTTDPAGMPGYVVVGRAPVDFAELVRPTILERVVFTDEPPEAIKARLESAGSTLAADVTPGKPGRRKGDS